MGRKHSRLYRIDPTFDLQTPLLFAHRGGALEVPESTILGFKHGTKFADVQELDVQLTRDGEFVVWHGPELDNVRVIGESDRPAKRPKDRRKIYHFDWSELDGNAWVADPKVKQMKLEEVDLSTVPKEPERRLLLLTQFLDEFPDVPLNIEMKKSFKRKFNDTDRRCLKDNIRAFTEILENDPSNRTVVVVSAYDDYIDEFRDMNDDKFPTGLSIKEQMGFWFWPFSMKNRVLETSYYERFSSKRIVENIRNKGGSSFVFLTGFLIFLPACDSDPDKLKKEVIFKILDRGVDGIMTDRPERVRQILG